MSTNLQIKHDPSELKTFMITDSTWTDLDIHTLSKNKGPVIDLWIKNVLFMIQFDLLLQCCHIVCSQ